MTQEAIIAELRDIAAKATTAMADAVASADKACAGNPSFIHSAYQLGVLQARTEVIAIMLNALINDMTRRGAA